MLLSRMARAVAREAADHPLTWRACHAVRDLLGGDGASLTIENSTPDRVTLCATDDRSAMLENLQDVLGEGPGMDAFDSGQSQAAGLDPVAEARWPQFIPAAGRVIGAGAFLWSLPMCSDGLVIGSICLYRRGASQLAEPLAGAEFLASAVAATLLRDPEALSDEAGSAWSSRAVVHQAAGMLVGKLGVSTGQALAMLRSRAFTAGRELRDIAQDVVERRLDLSAS